MSFPREDLALLEQTAEVEIETQAPAGPAHRTVIWIAVDEDDVFVRSYRGADARWYREAVFNPSVAIHVKGRRLTAIATSAADPASVERVSQALARKYEGDPAVRAMVRSRDPSDDPSAATGVTVRSRSTPSRNLRIRTAAVP